MTTDGEQFARMVYTILVVLFGIGVAYYRGYEMGLRHGQKLLERIIADIKANRRQI